MCEACALETKQCCGRDERKAKEWKNMPYSYTEDSTLLR